LNQTLTKISHKSRNIIALASFLLLLIAFDSGVCAQTLPSQQPHGAQSGSSTNVFGTSSFLYILVALIVIIVVVVVVVVAIILQSKKKNTRPQTTTQKVLAICPNCKSRIEAENNFCPRCGADIRVKP
jgi:uncharacterized paraquat-inducible protein A